MLGFLIIVFSIFQSKKRPFPQNGFSLEWSLLSVVLNIIGCLNIFATLTSGFGNPLGGQAWGGRGILVVLCSEEFVVDVDCDSSVCRCGLTCLEERLECLFSVCTCSNA